MHEKLLAVDWNSGEPALPAVQLNGQSEVVVRVVRYYPAICLSAFQISS